MIWGFSFLKMMGYFTNKTVEKYIHQEDLGKLSLQFHMKPHAQKKSTVVVPFICHTTCIKISQYILEISQKDPSSTS